MTYEAIKSEATDRWLPKPLHSGRFGIVMSVGGEANVEDQEIEDDVDTGTGVGKRCKFEKNVEYREAMEEIG